MDREIYFEIIPAGIYKGMRGLGINEDQMARMDKVIYDKLAKDDIAYWKSIQDHPIARKLGIDTYPKPKDADIYILSERFKDQYFRRLEDEISGEFTKPPFYITMLGNNTIAIVVDQGASACLQDDNNVLAVLSSLLQKVLDIREPTELMRKAPAFMDKFILMNARINPNKPPQPVYG